MGVRGYKKDIGGIGGRVSFISVTVIGLVCWFNTAPQKMEA